MTRSRYGKPLRVSIARGQAPRAECAFGHDPRKIPLDEPLQCEETRMNKPAELKLDVIPLWIDGRAVTQAPRMGDVYNPATGQVVRRVPYADAKTVDAAVQAARRALPAWRDTPVSKRVQVHFNMKMLLEKHLEELTYLCAQENGKKWDEAMGDILKVIEVVEFACGAPQLLKTDFTDQVGTGIDNWVLRQPLGVVAGITPFNFPVMVPMWMFPMAIATGNTDMLDMVPGIGKKTAERLLLELRDKLGGVTAAPAGPSAAGQSGDIVNALLALGYNDREAQWAVSQLPPGVGVTDGIRQALRSLSKSKD